MRRRANQTSRLRAILPIRRLPSARLRLLADLHHVLGVDGEVLQNLDTSYSTHRIPKRNGSWRVLTVPNEQLKALQRNLVRRSLGHYRAHDAAHGFVPGRSNISHASVHTGSELIVRLDLRDFFGSTTADDGYLYFRRVGWSRLASRELIRLCFVDGALPQGAPSSPVLSNVLNYRMDQRLTDVATRCGATYSRYVDDLAFSWPQGTEPDVKYVLRASRMVVDDEGYQLQHSKTKVMRRSGRQLLTGLVVNDDVNLPRAQRRKLRAARHRLEVGREATWTAAQLDGYDAYLAAINRNRPSR